MDDFELDAAGTGWEVERAEVFDAEVVEGGEIVELDETGRVFVDVARTGRGGLFRIVGLTSFISISMSELSLSSS
jgi:hypothetical protein